MREVRKNQAAADFAKKFFSVNGDGFAQETIYKKEKRSFPPKFGCF